MRVVLRDAGQDMDKYRILFTAAKTHKLHGDWARTLAFSRLVVEALHMCERPKSSKRVPMLEMMDVSELDVDAEHGDGMWWRKAENSVKRDGPGFEAWLGARD